MDQIRFIVFGRSRTGSSWVQSLLNSHGKIECRGEILKYSQKPDTLFTSAPATGFRLFFYHQKHPESLNKLKADENLRIIHLRRKNLLKMQLSKRIMGTTGHCRSQLPDGERIRLDPERLRRVFLDDSEERELSSYQSDYRFELVYEDLERDVQRVMKEVQLFLDQPPQHLRSNYRKLQKRPLPQVIENFEALREVFRETPFSKFFSDEG